MKKGKALFPIWVIITVAASVFPFAWFLITSFKTEIEVTSIPPVFFPSFNLDFYESAIKEYRLLSFIKNSLIVASLTTAITILLSSLAGYALSRLKTGHRKIIMGALISASMFPQISIAGPLWKILYSLGWLNSYKGLVFPYVTLTLPLGIWILTAFFAELPVEIEDAAKVDGCSHVQVLMRIIAPLAMPGIFTAAILVFIYAWNEFFFALLIMTEQNYRTLPVGIALFQGQYTMPWGEIASASTIATIPLVIMVMIFQRRIVSGLSAGAVKG